MKLFFVKTEKDRVQQPEKRNLRAYFPHSNRALWPGKLGEKNMRGKLVPGKAIFILCMASFLAGSLFTTRTWTHRSYSCNNDRQLQFIPNKVALSRTGCDQNRVTFYRFGKIMNKLLFDFEQISEVVFV